MSEIQSTIEINGKTYNMRSGQVLGSNPSAKTVEPKSTGRIDGFIGDNNVSVHTISHQHKLNKTAINHIARSPAKANTLVRSIGRPSTQHLTTVNKAKPGEFVAKTGETTTRSPAIKKFHQQASQTSTTKPINKIYTEVAVKTPTQNLSHMTIEQLESKFKSNVVDPFEEAIKEASSHIHELHIVESPFSRIVKIFHPFGSRARVALTAVVVVSAFIIGVYLTIPSIKVKMASLQASIPASLPKYQPAGFGIYGPIKAEPGKVIVNYKSNTDSGNYRITQQASDWSSQSLLNNQVLATAKPFQTYQQNGKTVYVYDNNKAVWVDAGILYSIEG